MRRTIRSTPQPIFAAKAKESESGGSTALVFDLNGFNIKEEEDVEDLTEEQYNLLTNAENDAIVICKNASAGGIAMTYTCRCTGASSSYAVYTCSNAFTIVTAVVSNEEGYKISFAAEDASSSDYDIAEDASF